ncbi:MAG: efflux RND transporter permease subunit [Gammaproteobacteria bacterium]|jgi:multidrug efflux pump subunit AcrB
MNIAEIAIKRRVVTWVLTAFVIVAGIGSYQSMGRLEDPEFTIKQAIITTAYPGATAEQVEEEVTDKIETKIQEMSEVLRIWSINVDGVSRITVEMQKKYDRELLPAIWQRLRNKVADVQPHLPPGAMPSVVNDDFGDVYGILLAVTGDGYSFAELKEFAKFLRKELLLVKDVAKIIIQGDQQETIYVDVDRSKITQLGISLMEIFDALEQKNVHVDSGRLRAGEEYVRINPTGTVNTVDAIRDLVIGSRTQEDGEVRLIYLKDIAEVIRDYKDPYDNKVIYNDQDAVVVGISTALGGNVVEMGNALAARVRELTRYVPVGMEIHPLYVQSNRVEASINAFIVNLAEAVAIVFIVLMAFMGLRSGAIIGVALVLTVLATFIFMKMQGVLLERISLGALVIALGMLVDNAIVIIDGMLVRIQKGMDRMEAAKEVVAQNMWPLFGATVIAVLAFGSIGLSDDSTGEYTRSLFLVILFSLMLSWLIAITVVPLMGVSFIKAAPADAAGQEPAPTKFSVFLEQSLDTVLRYRYVTVAAAIVLLVGAVFLFGQLKQSFFPNATSEQFFIDLYLPKGTDIRTVEDYARELQDKLQADERVHEVTTFVGAAAPRFILTYEPEKNPTSYAFMLVTVEDYKTIDTMMTDYYTWISEQLPRVNPRIHKVKLGPGKPPVEPTFYGPNHNVLRNLGDRASKILRDSGAVAIRSEWGERKLEIQPVFDEARASKVGVSRETLAASMEMSFEGFRAGTYREDDELLPIYVRASAADRAGANEIENIQVWSDGLQTFVPISQVISGYKTVWVDPSSNRKNRKRWYKVSADPQPGVLNAVLFSKVKPQIEAMELPPGYELEWEGEYMSQTEAQDALASSIPMFVVLMILIVVFLFNSIRKTLVIWLTVPLASIGVAVGLFIFEQPFDFMALLGFLSLSGMLIKNSIVLLDEIGSQLERGVAPYEALIASVQSRARPVSMAALTTVLGMIPLLQDPFFVAMAVTIMAGLAFATVLSLIVVPVLYAIFFNIRAPGEQVGQAQPQTT